jgi:5'-nucleotidase / UDP-sugar diphosphatase
MRKLGHFWPANLLTLVLLVSATPLRAQEILGKQKDKDRVEIVFLHLNDIYEITPLRHGTLAGLSRVATLHKELIEKYSHVFTLHAGDFLSPSAVGNAKIDGKRLAGQQMVAVLKTVGIDFIILGNHEFDLDKQEFEERLTELRALKLIPELKDFPDQETVKLFDNRRLALFSTNVTNANGNSFSEVPRDRLIEIKENGVVRLKVGLLGLTMDTKTKYAKFQKPVEAARYQLKRWQKEKINPDLKIALTHQSLEEDEELARHVPEIDLILGGHEHENTHRRVLPKKGENFIVPSIYRADANAVTVYVHVLTYNTKESRLERITSKLRHITDAIPEDPVVAAVVKQWTHLARSALRAEGYDPEENLCILTEAYDGRELSVRNKETNLTRLIGDAMLRALPAADPAKQIAVYNSGSIRIDDILYPGQVTMYDVLRILPFPNGRIMAVNFLGKVLQGLLDKKGTNPGTGAFLQMRNVTQDKEKGWLINGKELKPDETYQVAINNFLLDGKEENYAFIKNLPGVGQPRDIGDWRHLVADQFRIHKEGNRDGRVFQKGLVQIQPVVEPPLARKGENIDTGTPPQKLDQAQGLTPLPAGQDGLAFKDRVTVIKDIATALGIFVAGFWALAKFLQFRLSVQSTVIKIIPRHHVKTDRYLLYVQVEIQNVGNVMINGHACSINVVPIIGGQSDIAHTWNENQLCHSGGDPGNLNVIDKEEFITFSFFTPLEFMDSNRPEACKIIVTFASEKILKSGGHLGWVREKIYLFDKKVNWEELTHPEPSPPQPASTAIDKAKIS